MMAQLLDCDGVDSQNASQGYLGGPQWVFCNARSTRETIMVLFMHLHSANEIRHLGCICVRVFIDNLHERYSYDLCIASLLLYLHWRASHLFDSSLTNIACNVRHCLLIKATVKGLHEVEVAFFNLGTITPHYRYLR